MKKIITFFFVFSLLGAENKKVAVKFLQKRGEVGNQLYYLPNHHVPFTGKAVAMWPNGQKMTEISYKDGKHHGLLSMWYENGQWRRKVNFVDGKKDGVWKHCYENGQQSDQLFYLGSFMVSAIVWKPNGEICFMTDVNTGNGMMVKYTDEGMEWLRISYKDGEKCGYHFTHKDSVQLMN